MAGAFDAKVDISTAEAVAGLQALRTEAKNLGPAMAELDAILKTSKVSLKEAATEFTALVAAQRAAAAGSKELAAAKILEARESAIASAASDKSAESDAKVALTNANRARTEDLTAAAITRRAVADVAASDKAEVAAAKTAAAAAAADAAQNKMNGSLANSRYLMYDVGATYGILSVGLLAIPAATAAVAAAYQKDFAQVLRITGQTNAQSATLMQGLKDLGTQIPLSFKDMTDIAQMGAHLQLGNEGLVQFTETVAKFSATTGVATDTAASMFSKMKTMFAADAGAAGPDYFNRMGSSIAEMGTKIVATDQQVTSMVTSVQAVTASAGFSTQATIGLSGAMASLSIQPEMARGALTRMFAAFNRDSADATGKMQKFGDVIGMSGAQASALWKSNPDQFFTSLIGGLNKAYTSGQSLTGIFDGLGIKNVRDINTLQRLAVGYEVLTKAQDGANKGYADGTALNELSKPVFETVVAKLKELATAWMNLGETLGHGPLLAAAASLVQNITQIATTLDHLSHTADGSVTPLGMLLQILLGFSAVTAIFLGFKGVQALVMAGMLGFQEASAKGMGSGLGMSNMMKTLAQTMLMAKGATEQQTQALIGQGGALRALAVATATSSTSIKNMTVAEAEGEVATVSFGSKLKGFGSGLLGLAGGPIGIAITAIALLTGAFLNAQVQAESAGKAIADAMSQGADQGTRAIAEQLNNRKVQLSPTEGDISFSKLGQSVTEVAKQVNVSFADIVKAVAGGTDSAAAFQKKMQGLQAGAGLDKFKSDAYGWLGRVATEMAGASKNAADGMKAVNEVAPDTSKALSSLVDPANSDVSAFDALTKALKDLNDETFNTLDAQAALQDSLGKLGDTLFASKSFDSGSAGGRANIKAMEDALTKGEEHYAQLKTTGQMSAQQAAQGYAAFVDSLISEIKTKGGQLGNVEALAKQTKDQFTSVIGGGDPVSVPVTTDKSALKIKAVAVPQTVQEFIDEQKVPEIGVNATTTPAQTRVLQLAQYLAQITGYPYQVVLDALTKPGADKANEIKDLLTSIENHTYVAPVNADTSSAVTNVRNFVNYAKAALASLNGQTLATSNTLARLHVPGFTVGATGAPASIALPGGIPTPAAPDQVAAPTQAAATGGDAGTLAGLTNAYNIKQAEAADKAAKAAAAAAKKAQKDFKELTDGITEATHAAEDFGNRMKTGLTSAFNQQYGLTSATDAYHSALNAVNQKRADEIKQVTDLTDKIRVLNDERDKELITANKAKIEQSISMKYGETARAADYGNQAATALDNAAGKQKEINTDTASRKTIQDGIGLLTGYSDAAIANRTALRDLESKMIDMISAYASQGHSVDEVRQYAQGLTAQYKIDVGQMGLNMTAVQNLTGDMGRYIDTINRVPRLVPVQVTADTSQADQAMADAAQKLADLEKPVVIPVEVNMRATWDWNVKELAGAMAGNNSPLYSSIANVMGVNQGAGPVKMFNEGGPVRGFADGGMIPGTPSSDPKHDNMMAKIDGGGFIKVRSREFIQPEAAVNHYGPEFMEAVRTLKLPKFAMSSAGGSSGNGGGGSMPAIVGLDAHTLAFLASIKQDVKLYTENRLIAEAANAGNREFAAEGRN